MRLRHVARVNPSTAGFGKGDRGLEVSLLSLDKIWADWRFDPSHTIEFSGDVESYNQVTEGDLLVPKVAPTFSHSRVALADGLANGRALATSEVFVVRASSRLDARFLRYRLLAPDFRQEGEAGWAGVAGLKRISADFLRDVRIEPSAWKRRAQIVEFLDYERDRVRVLAEELADYEERLRDSWISVFERETTAAIARRRLKHFGCNLILGPFGSLLSADDYVSGAVPIINPIHIHWTGLQPQEEVTIPAARASQLARYRLRGGDVVLARRGELGRAAVVTEAEAGYLCGTGSARIRLEGERLDPRFLVLMLLTEPARAHLDLTAVGSTMPNLNASALMDLSLPDWSLEKQQEAVALAHAAHRSVRSLVEEVKATRRQLAEYLEALIAESVRGVLPASSSMGGTPVRRAETFTAGG